MGLPAVTKSWQYFVNQTFLWGGGAPGSNQALLLAIKNKMKSWGSGAWTVVGSSNSVAAALDAADRWAVNADLVGDVEGNAHSWIVLKQTGIAANFQILIDCTSSGVGIGQVWFSVSAGFTGGSTTARPTATDEVRALNAAQWFSHNTDAVLHMAQSTDGACLRVVIYSSNTMSAFWQIEKPTNTNAAWTAPAVVRISVSPMSYGNLSNAAGAGAWGRGPSGAMNFGITAEGIGGTAIGQTQTTPNGLDGSYPLGGAGLWTQSTGMVGRHGALVDMWWGSTTPNDADTYPNDTSRQFVQIGDVVIPWNGTVFATA